VLNHIYNRQMSYKTGVMTCRSTIDGVPLGEKLSSLYGGRDDSILSAIQAK
jgi:hypothetical protein